MYETTDFYLACYLRYCGHAFEGLRRENGRSTFVFRNVDKADVLQYYNREPREMDALGFVTAIRHTRELLYNLPD